MLWYWPVTGEGAGAEGLKRFDEAQPLPGLVVHVWSDTRVNLTVFDALGMAVCIATDILQDGQERPPNGGFAEWIPINVRQTSDMAELRDLVSRPDAVLVRAPTLIEHQDG